MINIKVLSNCAEVSYQLPNSTKRQTKVIGISDIPALFDTKISYDSGLLPMFGESNSFAIQRIIQKDNLTFALIQCLNPYINILHTNYVELTTDQKKALKISDLKTVHKDVIKKTGDGYTCYSNIHLPNLLFAIGLKKDTRGQTSMFKSGLLCYKEGFITENTQLYTFPFSNTHKESSYGEICWGDVRPNVNQVSQAVGVAHLFLGNGMNHHLYNRLKIKDMQMDCSSQILAYLALRSSELNSFPYQDIPLTPNIKYTELVNYLNQNWK